LTSSFVLYKTKFLDHLRVPNGQHQVNSQAQQYLPPTLVAV